MMSQLIKQARDISIKYNCHLAISCDGGKIQVYLSVDRDYVHFSMEKTFADGCVDLASHTLSYIEDILADVFGSDGQGKAITGN